MPEVVGNLSKRLAQELDVSGVMGRWVYSAGSHQLVSGVTNRGIGNYHS